jgi:hypothetical protein
LVRYFHSSAPLRNDLSSSDTEFHPWQRSAFRLLHFLIYNLCF